MWANQNNKITYKRLIMLAIQRVFLDNNHYEERLGKDGNAFVEAISWLYDPKEFKRYENNIYSLKDVISMPDFISCVYYIISAAQSKHPKQTVNDIIFRLKTNSKDQLNWGLHESDSIEHTTDFGIEVIVFKNMHSGFIEDVLWATYFYFLPYSQVNPDDKETKTATETLYNALLQESNYKEKTFNNHFLMKKTGQAMKRFLMTYPRNDENTEAKTSEPDNSEKLKAEIVRLKKTIQDQLNQINELQASKREENETAVIQRRDNKGNYITKVITAKEASEIVKRYNYLTKIISREDMKEMLAELTGLKASSFQRYL